MITSCACVCVMTSTLTYSQQLVNLVGAESSQCVCVSAALLSNIRLWNRFSEHQLQARLRARRADFDAGA